MKSESQGYFAAQADGVPPGARYLVRLDGGAGLPDPASRSQPEGVHGPSQVVAPDFPWTANRWRGAPLEDYVIYEIHVGTFTPEGTFDAVIPRLEGLKELGITALELMPVAQFPGERNWGYDGVHLFAAQNSYGGPTGLQRLVDACHHMGIAVVLDLVYNHLGPEGNHLMEFGPYFTERYRTAWGPALNFDGAGSDEVRRFFIENALYWLETCRIDALRLDAVHTILDHSPYPFLEELADAVHSLRRRSNRRIYLIAESSANEPRLLRRPQQGGYGLDAQWNDDFHHTIHTLLTGEKGGYYIDYGSLDNLAKAMTEGFVYSGEYSAYRSRRHGRSSASIAADKLVVFGQNHDQVGNRMMGDRLSSLVSFEALKLTAGLVLLSPYVPLLFMGEEYGETAPFPYFVSHSDPKLIDAVRQGRKEEFALFGWQDEPPDPQDPKTFQQAKLAYERRKTGDHRALLDLYRELLSLRRTVPPLAKLTKSGLEVAGLREQNVLIVSRRSPQGRSVAAFNMGPDEQSVRVAVEPGVWDKLLESADQRWGGPGGLAPESIDSMGELNTRVSGHGFVVFTHEGGN